MVMRTLDQHVENNHERAYCNMIDDADNKDDKNKWIDDRAKELIENFGNSNDWQIIELLKIKLESKSIDADIYNQFVTDICYSQANFDFNKKFQH